MASDGKDKVKETELYSIAINSYHNYENQYFTVTNIYVLTNSLIVTSLSVIIAARFPSNFFISYLVVLLSGVGIFLSFQMMGALGLIKTKIVYWGKLLKNLEYGNLYPPPQGETPCGKKGPFSDVGDIRKQIETSTATKNLFKTIKSKKYIIYGKTMCKEKSRYEVKVNSSFRGFELTYHGWVLYAEKHKESILLRRINLFPFIFIVIYSLFIAYMGSFYIVYLCDVYGIINYDFR